MAASELDVRARTARLLQRTGFGTASADEVTRAAAAGFDRTLDAALADGEDPGAAATPAPELGPLPPRPGRKARRDGKGDNRSDAPNSPEPTATSPADPSPRDDDEGRPDKPDDPATRTYRTALREQREKATLWWLDRMVAADRPWPEKRTLLWHNHWATSIGKVRAADAMLTQNETLRRLGGGDFRTLARAMVRDPALLVWLDASGNTAEAPNENLARELMELFVLGVGQYSETDVREAAKVLTGWKVDRSGKNGYTVRFRPRHHASGRRRILGHEGDLDARGLVDLLTEQPVHAEYVARRWWGWLVSAENGPSEESLERLVDAYGDRRDFTALLRALFADPAFADPDNVLVKQPVEYVVGTLRALGLRPSELDHKGRKLLLRSLTGLGQVPFSPPSVGGWPSGGAFLTTAAARSRITFAMYVTRAARESAALENVRGASAGDRPEALAGLLGVAAWSKPTGSALAEAAADPAKATAIALTSPEYSVLA